MEKKKLNLESLKVSSFIPSLNDKEKKTAQGGMTHFLIEFLADCLLPVEEASGATDMIANCPTLVGCPPPIRVNSGTGNNPNNIHSGCWGSCLPNVCPQP